MIPASQSVVYMERTESGWQRELARSRWDCESLAQRLDLPVSWVESAHESAQQFPLQVTESFLRRIKPGNLNDPLLRQILPTTSETEEVDGFTHDPVGDSNAVRAEGLLQKYRGRALLITAGACAIHCRYCFRRHYPYSGQSVQAHPTEAIEWLRDKHSVTEVILSGGDPLVLSDRRLASLLEQLESIHHLTTVRFHTRIPVVLPNRITPLLLQRLQQCRLNTVFVIHCNHPNEIDPTVSEALQQLSRAGVTLLNQSVLLKGVNDHPDTLVALSHQLFTNGVLPYYLHLLDQVQGSHSFYLPRQQALQIHHALREQLPGYLLPRLVCEIEGEASKTAVAE